MSQPFSFTTSSYIIDNRPEVRLAEDITLKTNSIYVAAVTIDGDNYDDHADTTAVSYNSHLKRLQRIRESVDKAYASLNLNYKPQLLKHIKRSATNAGPSQ
eukprot:TRINITY_DN12573_c2_g3_i1.p3 TRINITY_DN12573_c2_g3~~TRINITY_DN12573_c2_g3_i1.p3  ORF type:complete len:101 (+),score=13.10 TRINITY_DN12573_c2_g3_i1:2011-2313(+)